MNLKPLCLILLLTFPLAIFAQSNYHEGYIIKNNGDTVKGYINHRDWERSPIVVDFKVDKTGSQVQQFDAAAIKGFGITGAEPYITYTGPVSMDKIHFPDLPDGFDTTQTVTAIFLKRLVTGKHLTLFKHTDDIKTRFFIAETATEPAELRYHVYYNPGKQIVTSDAYKGQFLWYINKFNPANTKLITRAQQATFDDSSLEGLVNQINANEAAAGSKQSNIRLFVGIAMVSTQTKVRDIHDFTNPTVSTYRALSPKINFGIDVFGNPNVQQVIFRAELSFGYITPRLAYPVTINTVTTNEIYSINQFTTSLTPQVIFNFYNKDDVKVYLDGGIGINYSVYPKNKITLADANANNGTTVTPQPYSLNALWVNFPIQTGVMLNRKAEISFTFAPYAYFTNSATAYAGNKPMSLGVKWLFGKH
jgi:hypothetical protein